MLPSEVAYRFIGAAQPAAELTPLRGPAIVLFLSVGFCSTAFLIYRCGAADALHVGRHVSSQL